MFIMFVAKQTLQRVHCHVRGQLFAVAVRQVTQSLVHNEECILWLKPMGSICFFQSGFKRGGSSVLKGGGYLILPEQTCNVQGHIENNNFCSHLNPFTLNFVFVLAYKVH